MKSILSVCLLLFFSSVHSTEIQADAPVEVLDPAAAIELANRQPKGVDTVVRFQVSAYGKRLVKRPLPSWEVYLNSWTDYRDPRNLTVAIKPEVVAAFKAATGKDIGEHYRGKIIEVTGKVRKKKIVFLRNGRKTGRYYYQTHIDIHDPEQLREL